MALNHNTTTITQVVVCKHPFTLVINVSIDYNFKISTLKNIMIFVCSLVSINTNLYFSIENDVHAHHSFCLWIENAGCCWAVHQLLLNQ